MLSLFPCLDSRFEWYQLLYNLIFSLQRSPVEDIVNVVSKLLEVLTLQRAILFKGAHME